jgi:DeoR/GlpR family transcriptional regulator of sugar metabolism
MRDRIDKVMEILALKGYRSVTELSADLKVSEGTIRRYLDRLEEKDLIRRTHGGAYSGQDTTEVDYRAREAVRVAEKEAIGRLAWTLIEPGDSIYVDAGSTAAHLAAAMDDSRRFTVVTNSTIVLRTLEDRANIVTIMLGGTAHSPSHSLVGPLAEEAAKQFHFNKAFLGANGIDIQEGLTQSNLEEVPIKKRVAANSREVIVLADSTKFNRNVFVSFLPLQSVHCIVTDPGISPEHRRALEELNIRVLIATPTSSGGE